MKSILKWFGKLVLVTLISGALVFALKFSIKKQNEAMIVQDPVEKAVDMVFSKRTDLDSVFVETLAKSVVEATQNCDFVTPELVLAVMWEESKFDTSAVSNKGALGLMQLMPPTAKSYLKDMDINIKIGILYLEDLFKNDKKGTLSKYNSGNEQVGRGYAKRVLKTFEQFRGMR